MQKKKKKSHLGTGERLKIMARFNDGKSITDVAKEFGRSKSTVYRVKAKAQHPGTRPSIATTIPVIVEPPQTFMEACRRAMELTPDGTASVVLDLVDGKIVLS